jgi:short-subunit dehydrogenase
VAAFSASVPTFGPYAVSKHAILAVSENLEHELLEGGEAIGVSVLCPGVVNTRMPDAERNRPQSVRPSADPVHDGIIRQLKTQAAEVGMDPADVAGMVVDAIRDRRFFVLTHPDEAFDAMDKRLGWMRTGVPPTPRRRFEPDEPAG